jgi:hypothetical protein
MAQKEKYSNNTMRHINIRLATTREMAATRLQA